MNDESLIDNYYNINIKQGGEISNDLISKLLNNNLNSEKMFEGGDDDFEMKEIFQNENEIENNIETEFNRDSLTMFLTENINNEDEDNKDDIIEDKDERVLNKEEKPKNNLNIKNINFNKVGKGQKNFRKLVSSNNETFNVGSKNLFKKLRTL